MGNEIIDGLADALCIRSFDEDPEDPAVLKRAVERLRSEVEHKRDALQRSVEIERGLRILIAEKDKPCEWLHYDHCEGKGKSDRAWHWKTSCGEV